MDPNSTIGENADTIYRDFASPGSSVKHEPSKPEIRAWGHQIGDAIAGVEATVETLSGGSGAIRSVSRFWGSPIHVSAEDPYSRDWRALPAGLQSIPVVPVQVRGPGDVVMNRTVTEAFQSLYADNFAGDIAYVSPAGGAPGSAALNDRTKPYSLDYALRTLTSTAVLVALPGVYTTPPDFRLTDAAGAMKKAVFAETPGTCILRIVGDDIATLSFVQDGTYPDIWNATWSFGGSVLRVLRLDEFDSFGYHARLPKAASKAALNALDFGSTWDTGTKELSIKWDGADVNDIKGLLRAYWSDASGNSRHLQIGTEMLVTGFVYDGISVDLTPSGSTRATIWFDNNETRFAPLSAVNDLGSGAGRAFIGRWRCHASAGDGVNLNPAGAVSQRALMLVCNSYVTECGDFACFGANGTTNKQAMSSHGGDHYNFGNDLAANYGQQLADTSTDPGSNETWVVGVLARQAGRSISPSVATGFGFYGVGGDGASALDRKAWLDTCEWVGDGGGTVGLELQEGASAKVFNSPTLLPASVSSPSVAPVAYTPDAP